MYFQRLLQIQFLSCFLPIKTGWLAMADKETLDFIFDREDLYDRTTKKLKPIREVIDDHSAKDFPTIKDCGIDSTQNVYEADPDDCSSYFLCTGIYYVHRKCSPGLLFNRISCDCNWPELVDCQERPKPWTVPEYMGPYYVHEHYNVYEYTNTKLRRDKHHKHLWDTDIDDTSAEDDPSPLSEYYM